MNTEILVEGKNRFKGLKVFSIQMKENELIVEMKDNKGKKSILLLKGIIGFKDFGIIGKKLSENSMTNHGSFKSLFLKRQNGKTAFSCDFMEGEIK